MPTVRLRVLFAAFAVVCTMVLSATAAEAASIAFVRSGDVWLITADGQREYRVTSTGNFNSVTQADNGSLAAVDTTGAIHRLNQQGTELVNPFRFDRTPLDPDLSPDGSKIAFWYGAGSEARVGVTDSNQATGSSVYDTQNGWFITWYSNDRMIYSNGAGYINVKGLGTGRWSNWFSNPDSRKFSSAITRGLDRVVVVVRDYDNVGPFSMVWYTTNGAPPSPDAAFGTSGPEPTVRCSINFGNTEPQRPSFSPDGSMLAWAQFDGVYVIPVLDLDACTLPSGGFKIDGARSPDWGPADVPPPRTDGGGGGGGGTTFTYKATVPNRNLGRALRRGLKLRVTCSNACVVLRAQLRYRGGLVAKGTKTFPDGSGTMKLQFTDKGKRRLRRRSRAKLALKLPVIDAKTGDSYVRRSSVTLRR